MTEVLTVLLAVAKELAGQAKAEMPALQEGELIQREWYESGVYSRETVLNGETFLSQYDFRQQTCRGVAVAKRGERQSLT